MRLRSSAAPARARGLSASIRLLGLALLGWGAWLSFPGDHGARELEPGLTAFVLDASASATRVRTGWEVRAQRALREVAAEAEARGDDLLLVSYAADVRRLFGPAPARDAFAALLGNGAAGQERLRLSAAPERSLESRLSSALDLVATHLRDPVRSASRLVLRTDGMYTGSDPSGQIATLQAAGIAVEVSALEPPDQPDLALVSLQVAERMELGALATARIEYRADGLDAARERAVLELEVEHEDEVERQSLELSLAETTCFAELGAVRSGTTRVRGRLVLEQRATGNRGDRVPENDAAQAQFRSRDALICVVVSSDENSARAWLGPAPPGIELRFCSPEMLARDLPQADVCLSVDLSPKELDEVLLRSFLGQGGGVLVSGGWPLLRGWERGGFADRLPLEPDEGDLAPRDVQFVIDGSGSMRGEPFRAVREALVELVPAAPLADRVSLRFFIGALQERTVLAPGGAEGSESREARVRRVLAKTVPGGQTFLLSSLEQLAHERERSDEEALVLLLTDGHETDDFRAEDRARKLAEQFVVTRTRLEIIAVGPEPNLPLLQALLPEGESPTRVVDFAELTEVFQRSVNRERVESGLLSLSVGPAVEEGFASGLTRALRSVALPPIARALKMRERSDATVLLRTESGNPLLAVRRAASGYTAVLGTGPGATWSGALPLASLLRFLGREARAERAPRLEFERGLHVENAPATWPAQLTAHFYAIESGAERALGQCELGLGTPTVAGDPRAHRAGRRPDFLGALHAGAPLAVDLRDGAGQRIERLSAASPAAPEFTQSARLELAAIPERNAAKPASSIAGPGAPHAAAPVLLVLGLLLLGAAAVWDAVARRMLAHAR